MSEVDVKIKLIQNYLIERIIESNDDLKNQKLIQQNVTSTSAIEGFTSSINMVELVMRCNLTKRYFSFI